MAANGNPPGGFSRPVGFGTYTNARAEGINSLIQAAKARARGYRTKRNLIIIGYLINGKLTHLPKSPFGEDRVRLASF